MDKNFQEIFNSIKNQKAFLKDRYKVKEIGVFGSFVKGEQKRGSDVDILVVFENEMELGGFEYIGLMNDLEDYLMKILNIKPHLASKRHAMASDKWELIENEMVYVFEEKIKCRRGK